MKCTISINQKTRVSDLWPPFDHWYAFRPLFPFPSIGLDQLMATSTDSLLHYVYALAVVMLAFDVRCLILVYRRVHHCWGERIAQQGSWINLALPASLIFVWRTFDSITTFWIVLAFHYLLAAGENWASRRRFFALAAVAQGLRAIGHADHYVNIPGPLMMAPSCHSRWQPRAANRIHSSSLALWPDTHSKAAVVSLGRKVERGVPATWRAGR